MFDVIANDFLVQRLAMYCVTVVAYNLPVFLNEQKQAVQIRKDCKKIKLVSGTGTIGMRQGSAFTSEYLIVPFADNTAVMVCDKNYV